MFVLIRACSFLTVLDETTTDLDTDDVYREAPTYHLHPLPLVV